MSDLQKTENFCAPCLAAVPLVFGTGGAAASTGVQDQGTRNVVIWVSVGMIVLGIIIYMCMRNGKGRKKKCKTCPY